MTKVLPFLLGMALTVGLIGSGASVPPFSRAFGDGHDGTISVAGGQTIVIDQTATSVTAAGTSAFVGSSNGFNEGDVILLHQSQRDDAGSWELNEIKSRIDDNNWTLARPLANSYSSSAGNAQVIRVPEFHDVTVSAGGVLTAPVWNGATGGILVFLANGTVTSDGSISMAGSGFRGGTGNHRSVQPCCPSSGHAFPGESFLGAAGNCASPGCFIPANAGGGGNPGEYLGVGGGGAGGGHATRGANPCCHNHDTAGNTYGSGDSARMSFGSGGGGGYEDDVTGMGKGGTGGNGGGLVTVFAATLNVAGTVTAAGGAGQSLPPMGAGGGGGSGGSIFLLARTCSLASVIVSGGAGGVAFGRDPTWPGLIGGAGGSGRVWKMSACAGALR